MLCSGSLRTPLRAFNKLGSKYRTTISVFQSNKSRVIYPDTPFILAVCADTTITTHLHPPHKPQAPSIIVIIVPRLSRCLHCRNELIPNKRTSVQPQEDVCNVGYSPRRLRDSLHLCSFSWSTCWKSLTSLQRLSAFRGSRVNCISLVLTKSCILLRSLRPFYFCVAWGSMSNVLEEILIRRKTHYNEHPLFRHRPFRSHIVWKLLKLRRQ